MWQLYFMAGNPSLLALPGWMSDVGHWFADRFSEAGNALYESIFSPLLTLLGGLMFAQGRAMLNGGFAI